MRWQPHVVRPPLRLARSWGRLPCHRQGFRRAAGPRARRRHAAGVQGIVAGGRAAAAAAEWQGLSWQPSYRARAASAAGVKLGATSLPRAGFGGPGGPGRWSSSAPALCAARRAGHVAVAPASARGGGGALSSALSLLPSAAWDRPALPRAVGCAGPRQHRCLAT